MLGKVLITARSVASCEPALALMREAGYDLHIDETPTPYDEDRLIERARDAVALIFTLEPVSARLLACAPRLRVIGRPGVGYDTVDLPACTARGIPVTIAAVNDESVADFTMGLLLATARAIPAAHDSVQRHGWQRFVGTEVWRKTLAVIGLGRIGKALVRRASGFDMRVLCHTRTPDTEFGAEYGVQYVDLATALKSADFLSLHVPLTDETRLLINEHTLAQMKPGAYLINTARGGLIDEPALAAAVRDGPLSGAAVDVLTQEGTGSPSALIGVPGILVTPHMATFAREAIERVALSVARSVVAVLRGQRPASVVNPEAFGP